MDKQRDELVELPTDLVELTDKELDLVSGGDPGTASGNGPSNAIFRDRGQANGYGILGKG